MSSGVNLSEVYGLDGDRAELFNEDGGSAKLAESPI
jgi:hypothetical protein